MPTYTVEWTIQITADDPADAVRQAWGVMQDPESSATYFRVTEENAQEGIFRDFAADLGLVSAPCQRCAHDRSEHADYPESSKCLIPGCGCDSFLEDDHAAPMG